MRIVILFGMIIGSFALVGCNDESSVSSQQRTHSIEVCKDKICSGDRVPNVEVSKWQVFKKGGKWFAAPREYGGLDGSLAFYWPSRAPANDGDRVGRAPELKIDGKGRVINSYANKIEIFLSSSNEGGERIGGNEAIKRLQVQGRVTEIRNISKDLEIYFMKSQSTGKNNEPESAWYVAKNIKGLDGSPPVLVCEMSRRINSRCTMSFWWKANVVADIRLRSSHAEEWPEIYYEILAVLSKIREI